MVFVHEHFSQLGSSDELLEQGDGFRSAEIMTASSGSTKPYQHRSNTTVHVCWHRNTSVGREDYKKALLVFILYINYVCYIFIKS